jgi:hypothetical protein
MFMVDGRRAQPVGRAARGDAPGADRLGHEDRSADTFGALAAGCHAALSTTCPTRPSWTNGWAGWRRPAGRDGGREKTWRRCFTHMLQAQPDTWRTYSHKSVGWIEAWGRRADGRLPRHGEAPAEVGPDRQLRPRAIRGPGHARLFVPAKHPALHELFKGTPWAGRLAAPGPWAGVLRQMPAACGRTASATRAWIAKAKGIFIRLADALEV